MGQCGEMPKAPALQRREHEENQLIEKARMMRLPIVRIIRAVLFKLNISNTPAGGYFSSGGGSSVKNCFSESE